MTGQTQRPLSGFRLVFPLALLVTLAALSFQILPMLLLAGHLRDLLAGLIPFAIGLPLGLFLLSIGEKKGGSLDLERILLALGLGQGILCGFTFLLLTFHIFYAPVIPLLTALIVIVFLRKWKEIFYQIQSGCQIDRVERTSPRSIVFFLICAGILSLSCALLPPTNYDALEYHLAVPGTWLTQHGWGSFPHNVYAWFPMNVELLYLWGLALAEVPATTVINFLFAAACAVGIWVLGRRRGGEQSGWLAVILFISSGLIIRLVIQADIDLGVCFYSLLAWLAFVRWTEREDRRSLILSAIFVGISLGCKYIAAVSVWIPMLLLVLVGAPKEKRLTGLLWMLLLPACVALPWLVRNLVMVGNPVFPLLYAWFGGEGWTPAANAFFNAAHSPKPMNLGGHFIEMIRLPIDLTMRQSNIFSPLILVGIILIVIHLRKDRLVRLLLFYSFVVFALWFMCTQRNHRFLVTVAPPLALVAAWGLGHGGNWLRRPVRWPIWILCYSSLYLPLAVLSLSGGMGYLVEGENVAQYYDRLMPHMRAIHYLNEQDTNSPVRVLFVGEAQAYGSRCDAIVPVVFNVHPWVRHDPSGKAIPQTPEQAAARLREMGVTHVLYNASEMNRLSRGFIPLGWPDGAELARLVHLMEGKWLRPVFDTEEGIIRVYEVADMVPLKK
ncbi:MAG: glycosyltransferase family 39 protein [bacterium]